MEINVTLPFDHIQHPQEFLTPDAVTEIGAAIERTGFAGCNVTDHPCPSGRWLDAGGHHAQDPFVMLSFVAAATRTVRLQTGILVLPYRNPFITARAVATLDVFSGGRVALGIGAGYMKGEYFALGVDFERRNDLVDEYLAALKAAWTNDEFSFKGTGYEARGARILPRPVQKPHPPLLIGGNSPRAIRRAVEMGDAWYPFFTQPGVSSTSRTAEITGPDDLAVAIRYLHEHCEKIGRQRPPEIRLGSLSSIGKDFNAEAVLEKIDRLKTLGVVGAAVHMLATTRAEWCEYAQRFSEEVLARLPRN
ncbi:MAG TPA: LLM class F420-dependent oxidoreductase [Povalibacter sp.]|uniref:LLM class F420-dependent oxidoreductase n=1 Tax=Povalibacter sp. TaxID=1962978 RepID=UPI002C67A0F2|nr:LLM class F420-dependent oxidoreductase [Povalibacter sp.]HMN46881.1 LLM class F420-dependent oxidoreductase [Povalibacter sp.]